MGAGGEEKLTGVTITKYGKNVAFLLLYIDLGSSIIICAE